MKHLVIFTIIALILSTANCTNFLEIVNTALLQQSQTNFTNLKLQFNGTLIAGNTRSGGATNLLLSGLDGVFVNGTCKAQLSNGSSAILCGQMSQGIAQVDSTHYQPGQRICIDIVDGQSYSGNLSMNSIGWVYNVGPADITGVCEGDILTNGQPINLNLTKTLNVNESVSETNPMPVSITANCQVSGTGKGQFCLKTSAGDLTINQNLQVNEQQSQCFNVTSNQEFSIEFGSKVSFEAINNSTEPIIISCPIQL